MADHQQEILQALKSELWFLDMRGYEPSVREARQELSVFRDSPSCLNYALLVKEHPCAECWLMDFVPAEKRGEEIPCQHIPLNPSGDTIAAMGERGDNLGAQEALRDWLRVKIKEMETAAC